MSKAITFTILGLGLAAVGTGGVYLLNRDNFSDLPYTTLELFKKNKGGDCVKSRFGELDFDSKGNQIDGSTHTITDSYFTSDSAGEVSSCLVINWEREDSEPKKPDGKGKGNFRGLGTLSKGTKGMIVYTTTKPSSTENQIDLEGAIYFLEKEGDPGIWKIKKYNEHTTNSPKNVDGDKLDEWFPKKGEAIGDLSKVRDGGEQNYGGFVKDKEDAKKMCKANNDSTCVTSPKLSSFKKSWIWTPKTSEKDSEVKDISQGTTGFSTTVTKIFGDTGLTLTNAFSSFKGTGK